MKLIFYLKKVLAVLLFFCAFKNNGYAQKFYTKSGKIQFYSKTPLEKIEAVNNNATAVLDSKSGVVQISLLNKGFEFEKALMQEHFNENYMESNKYPKAVFSGTVLQNSSINYSKDGEYAITVKGTLAMHNVTREIETKGKIIILKSTPQLSAQFVVEPDKYGIKIPSIVAEKIAKTITISVACKLDNTLK